MTVMAKASYSSLETEAIELNGKFVPFLLRHWLVVNKCGELHSSCLELVPFDGGHSKARFKKTSLGLVVFCMFGISLKMDNRNAHFRHIRFLL
jgi:hypothetical protein